MKRSRIPVRVRKDSARADQAPPASSSSTSLPENNSPQQTADKRLLPGNPPPSSAERPAPTDRRIRSGSTSRPWPSPSSAENPTGKRRLPIRSSCPVPRSSSTNQSTPKRTPPSLSEPSLPGPAQSSSAKQPTDKRPSEEQSRKNRTDGRQTGHHIANNVAKDNSRVHYGDNYSATHHHNYRGPDSDDDMPRSLNEAITKNNVETYLNHVMQNLSFERMGLRKGTIAPALDNTCQWLLASSEYVRWRNPNLVRDHHGFMWIKSKAGAGKSTLMKFMLEHTQNQILDDNAISFFFNARGDEMERSLNGLYRHLLHQILCLVSRLQYDMVDDVNTLASQGWQLQPLKDLLRKAILDLRSERFTCFIDALDESSEDEIQDLIDFFEELGTNVVDRNICFRVCFSSRHYPNVELETCQYLNLDSKAEHENDIALYIKTKLRSSRGGTSDDLLATMQKKTQGVFLWAVLVTRILNKDYRRGDIHKARSRLESIPPDLHNLFDEMIHWDLDDPSENKNLVILLQWVAFARRPLEPQDLYFAIRSEDPKFNIPLHWKPNDISLETMKLFILNCSKGLVELTTSRWKPTVQFIHESVRDFLNQTGFDVLTPGRDVPLIGLAHNNLKQCCFRWISRHLLEHTSSNPSEQRVWQRLRAKQIPLLFYSIQNIIGHAELACIHGVPQEDFIKEFPTELWDAFVRLVDNWYMNRERLPSTPSLTGILTYHQAEALLAIELRLTGPRLLSCHYETALIIALSQRAMSTFKFLLDNGAPSLSEVAQQTETLLFAVARRNTAALQLMSKYDKHAVPLHKYAIVVTLAASYDYAIPVVLGNISVLLDNIKVPMEADPEMESAIQAIFLRTCMRGHEAIADACLKRGANPNLPVDGRPLFHAISAKGHNRILQMLFEHGADPDVAQGDNYYDAILEALRKGRNNIVHTLALQKTVNVSARPRRYYWDVMENLTLRNRGDTIGALLDNVQGFRAQDSDVYLESLRLAITRGYHEVVLAFKNKGVKLPEETLPAIDCAPQDEWVNALPASFFARKSVPGLSLLNDESVEDEMI